MGKRSRELKTGLTEDGRVKRSIDKKKQEEEEQTKRDIAVMKYLLEQQRNKIERQAEATPALFHNSDKVV